MKKILPLICFLVFMVQPAVAADITQLGLLGQVSFKTLSEDLGSALSYKPVTPAEPLGILGFDVGIVITATDISRSTASLNAATNSTDSIKTLIVPKLHVAKGLPMNFDIAAFISKVPTTNISLFGGEIRYSPLAGNMAMPAVAVRGALTKLTGVDQLDLDTKSLDVSISKGFLMFTPYAGVGQVWVTSTPNVGAALKEESFSKSKIFIGGNLNLGLMNIALEGDKTGDAKSASLKVGLRF